MQPIKRSTIVTGGHKGFWEWCQGNELLEEELQRLHEEHAAEGDYIVVYGEWAGPGIQKSVAISSVEKNFYAFDVKVVGPEPTHPDDVVDTRWVVDPYFKNLTSVDDYEKYEVTIDFNEPGSMEEALAKIVEAVETRCPIAYKLGEDGMGEGVVWKGYWNDTRWIFKTKGEKHKVVKEDKVVDADPVKLAGVTAFCDYAVTENRIDQAISAVSEDGAMLIGKESTGKILQWVNEDIIAEELAMLKQTGLEWDDVKREVSSRTRKYFFEKLDNGSDKSGD